MMDWRQDNPMQHPFWSAAILLLLLVPVLLLFAYFGLANHTFRLLGLSSDGATILVAVSLIGSVINIPLTRLRIVLADPAATPLPPALQWLAPIPRYYPPGVTEQVVALNGGGAVVPLVFSAHLLTLSSTRGRPRWAPRSSWWQWPDCSLDACPG